MSWKYIPARSKLPYSKEDILYISGDYTTVDITFAFSSSADISGLLPFPNLSLQLIQKAPSALRSRVVVVAEDGTGDYSFVAEAVRLEP